MGLAAPAAVSSPQVPRPWRLAPKGIAIFHGCGDTGRLSHYFLPRLFLQGRRVLFLDGANSADPRLIARFARQHGTPFEQFCQQIQLTRAFTCFQLTELVARVPRFLEDFAAQVLVITAFPDLYFDEDVRDWDARVVFEQALKNLQRWARLPLSVALFSDSNAFSPPFARRGFFKRVCATATQVWRFSLGQDNRLELTCERALPQLRS